MTLGVAKPKKGDSFSQWLTTTENSSALLKSMASLLLLLQPPYAHSSAASLHLHRHLRRITSSINTFSSDKKLFFRFKSLTVCNALTESNSPKSLGPDPQSLLQELADSFNLPPDYFAKLPRDLRLDLNDAAFDLSNGPVIDECGQELGMTLLNIARAWESADTSTSTSLIQKLPMLVVSLTNSSKSALGKRLVSAGRRFQSMGQYGQGELQKISKAMISTGKLFSATPVSETTNEDSQQETRMFKFGDLQVALTPKKAYIGAVIGFVFGILSWQLSQGIQSIPESSLQYANDNASLLAKSLRGVLLAIGYSSTLLSAFATAGLVLLGGKLKTEKE